MTVTIPFSVVLNRPFLVASFAEPQRVLSWSMLRPGLQLTQQIAWIEVRNSDLPPDVDASDVIRARVVDGGLSDAVVLVTSRDIGRYCCAHASVDGQDAHCLTTVGLSNSERVGARLHQPPNFPGTINTLVHIAHALSEAAMLEAISIATEARTTAVLDADVRRGALTVTGTGTDCIAIAAPTGSPEASYAGKHTAIGEAIGAAVYRATAEGIADWKADISAAQRPVAAK